MYPKYPLFVPTKGRWESCYTIKALEKIGIPYKAVIERQEYDQYAAIIKPENIIILPHQNEGLVRTRNWIWDYAQNELKTPYFWTFDDNIGTFFRFNKGMRIEVSDGTFLRIIEDFIDRYENIALAGMHYKMFAITSLTNCIDKPFLLNTRVYSNMLIRTDIPFRNRGFYNDDTDLCLQVLSAGFCTILFYAFLIDKKTTMTVKGGMTPHYQGDGRLKMAQELQQRWPQYVKITHKWGRWQHQVDYRPFKNNKLVRKKGVVVPEGINNYGMKLVKVDDASITTPHRLTQ